MTAGDRRLGAHAVHRVVPGDVGRRVSVRQLHAEEGRDVARDVVGRLLGYAHALLAIVDRHGQLHLVDEARIVASKIVPEHPRRPAEPADLGTQTRPLPREAARVLLLDPDERVLLAAHRPDPERLVWTAPGGGVRPGETHDLAAVRELREELGLDLEVGPWVWTRQVTFTFAGVWLDQRERWFLARTDHVDLTDAPLDDPGLDHVRWWTLAELERSTEVVAPGRLATSLATLLRDGPPVIPVDVGR